MVIESFRKTAPQLVAPCPHLGVYAEGNIAIPRQLVTMNPNGIYKMIFAMGNGVNDTLKIEFVYEMA